MIRDAEILNLFIINEFSCVKHDSLHGVINIVYFFEITRNLQRKLWTSSDRDYTYLYLPISTTDAVFCDRPSLDFILFLFV